MSRELEQLRGEIDRIDHQLICLLEERFSVTAQVGRLKAKTGKAVFDPEREKAVIKDRLSCVQNPDNCGAVGGLFEMIMANSRQGQRKDCCQSVRNLLESLPVCDRISLTGGELVAYGGVEGSFGEEALISFFGEETPRRGYPYFSQIIEAVRSEKVTYGILPIENSSTGAVIEAYDLLRDSGCYIVGEIKLPIRHCLLGLPQTDMQTIQKVYSHPQGLAQSSRFLQNYPDYQCISYPNTAMSAKLVRDSNDRTLAAIGSKRCAETYGLEILAENINDSAHNHTRFVVISKNSLCSEQADKISICFDLVHTTGSLYQILTFFAMNKINLLKLESRPIPEQNWEYSFFIDFEGNLEEQRIRDTLCSVLEETSRFRYLGNYVGS